MILNRDNLFLYFDLSFHILFVPSVSSVANGAKHKMVIDIEMKDIGLKLYFSWILSQNIWKITLFLWDIATHYVLPIPQSINVPSNWNKKKLGFSLCWKK